MISRTLGGTTYVLTYDGDSKRVKAVLGGSTYAYVGAHYEVGPSTRKYYTIGGQRVAMRDSGLGSNPYYLINDHLGSHALTANNVGLLQAEVRYKAWGEDRYASGTMPTAYRFIPRSGHRPASAGTRGAERWACTSTTPVTTTPRSAASCRRIPSCPMRRTLG